MAPNRMPPCRFSRLAGCRNAFGVGDARPFLAPEPQPYTADITVSLGVGGNPQKRIAGPFESRAVAALLATGKRVMIDRGVGGEETERVDRSRGSWAIPQPRAARWLVRFVCQPHPAEPALLRLRFRGATCGGRCSGPTGYRFCRLRDRENIRALEASGSGPIWTIKVSAEEPPFCREPRLLRYFGGGGGNAVPSGARSGGSGSNGFLRSFLFGQRIGRKRNG